MADLANLEDEYCPDEGSVCELNGPDGAPLFCDDGSRMTLTLLGADSDVLAKHRNSMTNRRIKDRGAQVTAESIEADAVAYLVKATVGWNVQFGGEKPPLTPDAVAKVYRNKKLSFIRDRADAHIAERSNFLKA